MASGYELQGSDIRTRWLLQQTMWSTESSTAVIFDNYDEDDTSVTTAKHAKDPWIRVSILEGDEKQVCFGPNQRWRNFGVLTNEIYVPMGFGPGRSDRIADYIADDWRGISLRNMTFRGPARIRVGSGDGRWYQLVVEVPFQRDDYHSISTFSEGAVAIEITLSTALANGFTTRQWVTPVSGEMALAIADGIQGMNTVLPITAINSATEFVVATGGSVTFLSHGYTVGATLFLDQSTAGDITETEPSSGWIKQVGVVLDANTIDVQSLNPWYK